MMRASKSFAAQDFFLPASVKLEKRRASEDAAKSKAKKAKSEAEPTALQASTGIVTDEIVKIAQSFPEQLLKQEAEDSRENEGKPMHPFFARRSQQLDNSVATDLSGAFVEPSAPFHVTQDDEKLFDVVKSGLKFLPGCQCSKTVDALQTRGEQVPGVVSFTVASHQYFSKVSPEQNLRELTDYLKASSGESFDSLNSKYAWYHEKRSENFSADASGHYLTNPQWTDLYRPQASHEICGNRVSVSALNDWLCSWKEKISAENKTAEKGKYSVDHGNEEEEEGLENLMVITGPVGCGKSAAVYACAKQQGFEVIEINASDTRNGASLKHRFGEAFESHSVIKWSDCTRNQLQNGSSIPDIPRGNTSLLLFEEVDALLEEDMGFLAALVRLARTAKRPIILTSNRRGNVLPQLEPINISFSCPRVEDMVVHASMMCAASNISGNPWIIEQLVKSCRQDLRRLILLLQFWGQGLLSSNHKNINSGCFLRDSVQLCCQMKHQSIDLNKTLPDNGSKDSIHGGKWPSHASWLFDSEVQHCLLPQHFAFSFPCLLSERVACRISDAAANADEATALLSARSAEMQAEEQAARIRNRRRSKRRKDQTLTIEEEPTEISSDKTRGVERHGILPECDTSDGAWTELRSSGKMTCSGCSHDSALRITSALAHFEDTCSSCDLMFAPSTRSQAYDPHEEIASQLSYASFGYFAGTCYDVMGTDEEKLERHVSGWNLHDFDRHCKHDRLRETAFAHPRRVRSPLTAASLCDYTAYMARIADLERCRLAGDCRRRNRATHHLYQLGLSDEAVAALQGCATYTKLNRPPK